MRLDPPLVTAVVRVDADRDRSAVAKRRPRIDAIGRDEDLWSDGEVGRRIPKGSAALVPEHDGALDLGRATEEPGGPNDVALPQQAPDRSRGDPGHHGHRANVEAELRQQTRVTCRAAAEAEVLADHDHLGADPSEDGVAELRRLAPRKLRSELDDEHLVDTGVLQQLEAPLERREQLHVVAEHEPRVWPEGDHRDRPSRGEGSLEHASMAEMHSVEAADGGNATVGLELFRAPRDLH